LILSDGEYYETRCLLLPNLNYLVNNFKLRKGSIIRLDRFELNVIPNGKILVIEELSVLKNTISNDDNNFNNNNNTNINCTTDNERKSIMNNNLAETLKSIGIIGSLKPTSNNIQLKYKSPQIKNDTSNLNNTNTNNNKYKLIENKIKEILNSNESTDKNNNKNKFKKNKDDDVDDDDDEEEEEDDIDDDEEDDEYEDDDDDDDDDYDEEDEEDELNFEENQEEEEFDEEDDSSLKSVVDIILCKCNSCKEQNTLKLCYKLLELDENSSLEQIKAKYIKLNNKKINSEIVETIMTNNNNDESDKNECNLDKLIRKLLRRKLFTITDSDRQEIRAKAYNLILSKQIFLI
jgi:hypothetical protein